MATSTLEQLRLRNGRKAESMHRGGAMLTQGCKMLRGSVAFVAAKSILRIKRIHFIHDPVAGDLCDHAGCRDGKTQTVTPNYRRVRGRKVAHRKSVNQYMIGLKGKPAKRFAHRPMGRTQDVDGVDGRNALDRDCPTDMRRDGDSFEEACAKLRC